MEINQCERSWFLLPVFDIYGQNSHMLVQLTMSSWSLESVEALHKLEVEHRETVTAFQAYNCFQIIKFLKLGFDRILSKLSYNGGVENISSQFLKLVF